MALLFEDIEGRLAHAPWREAELRAVLDALAAATTPLVVAELPTAREVYGVDFARFGELTTDDDLDDWVRSRLEDLASS